MKKTRGRTKTRRRARGAPGTVFRRSFDDVRGIGFLISGGERGARRAVGESRACELRYPRFFPRVFRIWYIGTGDSRGPSFASDHSVITEAFPLGPHRVCARTSNPIDRTRTDVTTRLRGLSGHRALRSGSLAFCSLAGPGHRGRGLSPSTTCKSSSGPVSAPDHPSGPSSRICTPSRRCR